MKTKKLQQNVIAIIEASFVGMKKRQEEFVIVRLFDVSRTITLLSGNIYHVDYVRIDLLRHDGVQIVRVFYGTDLYESLVFSTLEEKLLAVNFLYDNTILPTEKEFLEANSLLNIPGIYSFVCGCE